MDYGIKLEKDDAVHILSYTYITMAIAIMSESGENFRNVKSHIDKAENKEVRREKKSQTSYLD